MIRQVQKPKRFEDFIDGAIPAELFEDEYLIFKQAQEALPTASQDTVLHRYRKFMSNIKRQSLILARRLNVSNFADHFKCSTGTAVIYSFIFIFISLPTES